MSRERILEARDLVVHRGPLKVLEIPDLDLRTGEVLALMGPNGAGKTTLMLTLAGLLAPSAGSVTFKGATLRNKGDRERFRRRTTMVFQDPLLFDTTVSQNIASGLKLRGISAPERKPRVVAWAERLGLGALLDRPAHQLSGGKRSAPPWPGPSSWSRRSSSWTSLSPRWTPRPARSSSGTWGTSWPRPPPPR
ncbi:MAG: ABC transporter ATP-binding protein [Holophagaceae bacterium]|nr:ABC transporter ATP-binding protein [Holophagaceae bacterium]